MLALMPQMHVLLAFAGLQQPDAKPDHFCPVERTDLPSPGNLPCSVLACVSDMTVLELAAAMYRPGIAAAAPMLIASRLDIPGQQSPVCHAVHQLSASESA